MSDAEIIHVEELPASPALFGTSDPVAVIEKAQQTAAVLKDIIDQKGLVTNIRGREHVRVEGWTTLGAMLGVFPSVEWTREIEGGWEARVIAMTLSGAQVGAAEAMCTRSESTWKNRDDYALRSMAQTRATSKAMRLPLGFIVQLAGYDPTPAEEMPPDGRAPTSRVYREDAEWRPVEYIQRAIDIFSGWEQERKEAEWLTSKADHGFDKIKPADLSRQQVDIIIKDMADKYYKEVPDEQPF